MIISKQNAYSRKLYFMVMNFVYSIKCQFDIELDFEICNEIDFQTVEMYIFILVSISYIIFLDRSFSNLKVPQIKFCQKIVYSWNFESRDCLLA